MVRIYLSQCHKHQIPHYWTMVYIEDSIHILLTIITSSHYFCSDSMLIFLGIKANKDLPTSITVPNELYPLLLLFQINYPLLDVSLCCVTLIGPIIGLLPLTHCYICMQIIHPHLSGSPKTTRPSYCSSITTIHHFVCLLSQTQVLVAVLCVLGTVYSIGLFPLTDCCHHAQISYSPFARHVSCVLFNGDVLLINGRFL
jgi:hypothetical protein